MKRIITLLLVGVLIYPHSFHAMSTNQGGSGQLETEQQVGEELNQTEEQVVEDLQGNEEEEEEVSVTNVDLRSADDWLAFAQSRTTASERLQEFVAGYLQYSSDQRFVKGINDSARALLNWSNQQHNQGQFGIVIDRYETILDSPGLNELLKNESEVRLRYAKENKKIPSATQFVTIAKNGSTASERLDLYIEGYYLYSNDNRFEKGINDSALALFNWATQQHRDGHFDVAVERYQKILLSPLLSDTIRRETERKLNYAVQETLTPDLLFDYAQRQSTASERLEAFIDGYEKYPNDIRFGEGINTSARALLNWTTQQHQQRQFQTAIGRYEVILASPALGNSLRRTVTIQLGFASEGQRVPTANEFVQIASNKATASERLVSFDDGSFFFPNDSRFQKGINDSARALLNWTSQQHGNGNFSLAVDRYEYILSFSKVSRSIKDEVTMKLDYAKANKKVPTPNEIHQEARSQSTATERLEKFIEGYQLYPNDKRFETGINDSANALLTWTRQQHQQGQFSLATGRYEFILSAPVLSNAIKKETQARLSYSKRGQRVPTANQLNDRARNQSTASERLAHYLEGHLFYPNDKRFADGIAASSRSVLDWAESRHRARDFQAAIGRYKHLIGIPEVPKSIRDQARFNLNLAEERRSLVEIKRIVNAKVQNYTYRQMENDIRALERMYPGLIETKVLGKSLDGRNIYAVKLGRGSTEVLINGSNHAREHMTTNVIMKQIDEYAFAYANGNRFGGFDVKQVLDRTSIWYVPMVNPDGVTLVQQGANALNSNRIAQEAVRINGGSNNFAPWKANARGVDLNRQFPHFWNTITNNPGRPSPSMYKGPRPLSEPESITMYNFVQENQHLKTIIDYHSSGEVIFARNPGPLTRTVSNKTGYPIIDVTRSTSGGGFASWFAVQYKKPGFTLEISPYVGDRPVPVSNWDRVWRQNDSVGLIVADEAYTNRNRR
ncbi:M14 family metallopeptidase [Alkalihalobacterium bogoriense]|uniref:M14 family metallopeptidase n=1 Tax=Alkalihalobacterium bogoriense TaxID=246272 RepID=UPI00068768B3|nr:M14 family metallocarboxypeptidase [Alkalihalobacterium bogoriense]